MKKLKTAGFVVITVLSLILLLRIVFGYASHHYLIPFLISQVSEKTAGRYILSIQNDRIDPGFFTIDMILSHVELTRDSSHNQNSGIDLLDKFDVGFSFDTLKISVLNPVSYLLNKKIEIREIDLLNPRYVVSKNINYKPDEQDGNNSDTGQAQVVLTDSAVLSSDTSTWKEFRQAQKSFRPVMRADHFMVRNLHFEFFDGMQKTTAHEVHGMNIDVDDLIVDKNNKLTVEDAGISIDSASALVSRNLARLDLKDVIINPDSFSINNFRFRHIVDRYQINKIKGFRASWLDVTVNDIRLKGLHPRMMINDSILDIDKISIGDVRLLMFKDKSEPVIDPSHKPLPPEQIRGIAAKFKIDTIEVQEGTITVELEAPDARRPGMITLNRFYAGISNLTNVSEFLAVNPSMEMTSRFALMDSAKISLNISFRIDSPEDEFSLSGHSDPFYAPVLNEFLGSQFFIDFSEGYINSLDFQFEGNNKANVGTLDLEYQDLRIEKFHEFKRYIDGKPNTGFIAFMGNTVIPNNRSKSDHNYKQAVIYYEKEYNRDFIHGTIMSMLSGLISSFGFSSRDLEKRQEQADELDASDTRASAEEAEEKAEDAKDKKNKVEKQKKSK